MKQLMFLVLLVALATGTAWAGVRLEWNDTSGTGADVLFVAGNDTLEWQTGGEAASLALGEASTQVQTPSLTFTLAGDADVAVQTPSLVASLTASHDRALTLETVTLDASGSHPGGSVIALYEWDLDGDGIFDISTASETLQHDYADDGVVLAQVRVTDELGQMALSQALQLEIVNRPPSAQFEVDLADATEASLIQFRDLAQDEDGTIASWAYAFGDGTTSTQANPSHAYDAAGIFQVMLAVSDDDGSHSNVFVMDVEVSNLGPQANFTPQQSTVSVNQSLLVIDQSIDPSPEGEIVHIAWDFGDGTYQAGGPSSDNAYSHVFSASGTYTVTLYVIDNAGAMARAQTTVIVL